AGLPGRRRAQARRARDRRARTEGDRGRARGGADPQGVRHPGMPGRRAGPGGEPAGDPGLRLGRPWVRADQGAGRACGRASAQARRSGPDRGRLRQGFPSRRPLMVRRIVLTMLALVSALLVIAVAPLGVFTAGRETDAFNMHAMMKAHALAGAAETTIDSGKAGQVLAVNLAIARQRGGPAWGFNAADTLGAPTGGPCGAA